MIAPPPGTSGPATRGVGKLGDLVAVGGAEIDAVGRRAVLEEGVEHAERAERAQRRAARG